jgi:hypothetical protein
LQDVAGNDNISVPTCYHMGGVTVGTAPRKANLLSN